MDKVASSKMMVLHFVKLTVYRQRSDDDERICNWRQLSISRAMQDVQNLKYMVAHVNLESSDIHGLKLIRSSECDVSEVLTELLHRLTEHKSGGRTMKPKHQANHCIIITDAGGIGRKPVIKL